MIHKKTSISSKATYSATNMRIDFKNFLNAAGDNQSRSEALLDCKDNTILRLDTNSG